MVKIKDIDIEKVKMAKEVLAVLEIFEITEEDLLSLKKVPAMEEELKELRQFKADVIKTLETRNANPEAKSASEIVKKVYKGEIKEFNPHYEQ